MRVLQSLCIAFSMYSRIPMPKVKWTEENMGCVLCFFPAVGAVEGLLLYGAGQLMVLGGFQNMFFAAVMTLLPLLITGGIHGDGLIDTLDAMGSWGDREKKLEILKDPHVGAFGVMGLAVYLIWSIAVWSEGGAKLLPVAACGCVCSRALSAFSVVTFPAAKKDGLAKTFQEQAKKRAVQLGQLPWFLAAAGLMLWLLPLPGAGALVCGLLTFWYYHRAVCARFGGVTGDLAGFFLQVCELAMLTGGAAVWYLCR